MGLDGCKRDALPTELTALHTKDLYLQQEIMKYKLKQQIILKLQQHQVRLQVEMSLLVQSFLNLILLQMEHLLQEDLSLDVKWIQTIQHKVLK